MTHSTILSNLFGILVLRLSYLLGAMRASWKGVRVGERARISPFADVGACHFIGEAVIGRDVQIGKGSYISSGWIFSAEIGQYCSIGYDAMIGPSEHDPHAFTTSPVLANAMGRPGAANRRVSRPVLEDEVWIGARAVVLRGIRIGRGAVIAAGAVVTTNVPEFEIWGGIPARRIGARHARTDTSPSAGSDHIGRIQEPR